MALGSHGRSMRLLAHICVSQKQRKEDAGPWINFSFPSFYSSKALNPWMMGTNFKASLPSSVNFVLKNPHRHMQS